MDNGAIKNCVVEVFVATEPGGKTGEGGTGFPVGRDLIMAARHVICVDESSPPASLQQIELYWRHPDVDANQRTRVDAIEWGSDQSEAQWDVVLLRARLPEVIANAAPALPKISATKPDDRMNWFSAGFAQVRGSDAHGVRIMDDMKGTAYSRAEFYNRFKLDVAAPPNAHELWAGASGSPVIVDDQIIGVIALAPPGYDAKALYATPMWRLLELESFRTLVTPRARADGPEIFQIPLDSQSTGEFENALRIHLDDLFSTDKSLKACAMRVLPRNPDATAKQLAHACLDQKAEDIVREWTRATNEYMKSVEGAVSLEVWGKCKQVHLALLTRLVNPTWIDGWKKRHAGSDDGRLFEIAVWRQGNAPIPAVELLVARLDPVRGIHITDAARPPGQIISDDPQWHLNRPPRPDNAVNVLGLYLLAGFGGWPEPVPEQMENEHWEHLDAQFQLRGDDEFHTFYLVVPPTDDTFNDVGVMQQLNRKLPNMIRFVMRESVAESQSPLSLTHIRLNVLITSFWNTKPNVNR